MKLKEASPLSRLMNLRKLIDELPMEVLVFGDLDPLRSLHRGPPFSTYELREIQKALSRISAYPDQAERLEKITRPSFQNLRGCMGHV